MTVPGMEMSSPEIDPSSVALDEAPEIPVGFPMPRNLALLDDRTPRVRVRTVTDRFPFPVPNGWFIVVAGDELSPGEIASIHYFGRDLVVYRTEDGTPHTVDAYCPHLGAHLGVGGKVIDGNLACPFHGWRFDGSGSCVEIPYAESERIPSKARVRTYPTIERNGMVWAWHHATEGDPFFEVPEVPELADAGWLAPKVVDFHISTSCQEMAENNHDFAHFKYVHGSETIPEGTETIEGTYKRTVSPGLERETFGLGLGVVRVPGVVTFLSSVTPIDTDNVHVRWTFTVPADSAPGLLDQVAEGFASGVTQDIPIWENKIYRPHPVLTKGEGGIAAHRNWSRQFYSDPTVVDAAIADDE
jgi:nitrite reductase/ring-hydroxylating ferredoxin subunit